MHSECTDDQLFDAMQAASANDSSKQQLGDSSSNVFDAKTDKGSADLYFHYYGMLMHQQNMLQVSRGCWADQPS